jgi:hypothetical protein
MARFSSIPKKKYPSNQRIHGLGQMRFKEAAPVALLRAESPALLTYQVAPLEDERDALELTQSSNP